jgi:hypothetical protein
METNPHEILKVLSHRDLEESFKSPQHCVLLDFQTLRYLPLTVDVLMTIVCNTTRSHQEANFEKYIKFYYEVVSMELDKFNLSLKAKMPFESFTKSCEYHKTFGLIYNVVVLMITMIPQDYFVDFSEDKFRDFAEGNRSRFILEIMENDDEYRESLVEAVEAIIEFAFKCRL